MEIRRKKNERNHDNSYNRICIRFNRLLYNGENGSETGIMTERQLQKIEELLLSSPQVSPFPEYEVHGNDENGRKETEK